MLRAELAAFEDKVRNKPDKMKLNSTDKKVLEQEIANLKNRGDDFRNWKVAKKFYPPNKSLYFFIHSISNAKLCEKVPRLAERFPILLEAAIQEQWDRSLKNVFEKTSYFAKPYPEKPVTMNRDIMQIGFKMLRDEVDVETGIFIISQDPKFEVINIISFLDKEEKNWICSLSTKEGSDLVHYITAAIKQGSAEKDFWHIGKGEKKGSKSKKYKV